MDDPDYVGEARTALSLLSAEYEHKRSYYLHVNANFL